MEVALAYNTYTYTAMGSMGFKKNNLTGVDSIRYPLHRYDFTITCGAVYGRFNITPFVWS